VNAAYLLAVPAVPDEAREVAIEKAKAGVQSMVAAAKQIVVEAKKQGKRWAKPIPANKLALRLVRVLERYRERWRSRSVWARRRPAVESQTRKNGRLWCWGACPQGRCFQAR
jgi:hypothetical protein